ncbi:MAG: hypothetical protein FH761_19325 [Firmicutes bacterium]|nr:hypothetical protein [Bacillota bacterium]
MIDKIANYIVNNTILFYLVMVIESIVFMAYMSIVIHLGIPIWFVLLTPIYFSLYDIWWRKIAHPRLELKAHLREVIK